MQAYYLLVTVNPTPGAYYNIGGTFSCSIEDMLHHLISISNCPNQIEVQTDAKRLRPIDADLQIPNTKKFVEHTGWSTEITFEQTMEDLLNYWREMMNAGHKFLTR